jgi:hypothetical protein
LPLAVAVARISPSRLNATPVTVLLPVLSGAPICWWLAMSHSRAVPSSLAVAKIFPCGLRPLAAQRPLAIDGPQESAGQRGGG